MTLNGVMALTLRYFYEFAKPVFQLITASSSIELIDQRSASVTHQPYSYCRVLSRSYEGATFGRLIYRQTDAYRVVSTGVVYWAGRTPPSYKALQIWPPLISL